MARGPTACWLMVVVVRRVMMMMVMVGIQLPILVKHLTWPPGATYGGFPRCRPVGLPAPRRQPVLLACFPRCISLIFVAHGGGVVPLRCSEHAPLGSEENPTHSTA